MGFTLNIRFHGTIAMVPRKDKTKIHLLWGDFPEVKCVMPLVAYIRFPRYSWDERANKRTLGGPPPDVKPQYADFRHVRLGGEMLTLCACVAPHDQTLQVNDRFNPNSPSPTEPDLKSIHWVADMEKLNANAGNIKPGLLNVPPTDSPGLLARMDLTKGRFQTRGVDPVRARFRSDTGREVHTPIARETELTIDILDDEFILESTPILGGPHNPALDMKFRSGGQPTLNIMIGHEPLADIYKPTPPTLPPSEVQAIARREFGMYYMLCQHQPVDPVFPLTGDLGPGAYCMKSRFNAV